MTLGVMLPAALWTAAAVLAPLAAPYVTRWLAERDPAWAETGAALAPWLHGLALPYLALFTGALPARFLGIYGSGGWFGWVWAGLLVAGLLFAARFAFNRIPISYRRERYEQLVLDEPRWALYRGAGWLWVGSFQLGLLVGLVLALSEWALTWRAWQPAARTSQPACLALARIGVSALVYALTGNLWLTIVLQVGLALLVEETST